MPARRRTQADEARERMRLFIAAAAVFVLLLGLCLLICMILLKDMTPAAALPAFLPFLVVGLLFFTASAFINANVLRQFMSYVAPGSGGRSD